MTFKSCIYFYIVDLYIFFLSKWKIHVIVGCLLNWQSITHLVSKILLPSVVSIKTISQIQLYFPETDCGKKNKIIVYHKYQHNYTGKYIYYHLKQLWSFLFIKNEQFMFVLIVAIPTSKTGQVIYGKDLILRIYFVKPRFLTTTESYHGYTLTTTTTYQRYLTTTTIFTQESELCLHNLCI
jgi:hypothetical protein